MSSASPARELNPDLVRLVTWAERVERAMDKQTERFWAEPQPNSAALRAQHGGISGELVHGLVQILWTVAARHMSATFTLMKAKHATGAGATMRASLETMLTTDWLLGSNEVDVRVGRACALVYRDFTRGVANADLEHMMIGEELVELMSRNGVVIKPNSKGEPLDFNGERVRKVEELVKTTGLAATASDMLPLATVYSRLSGVVHGQSWRFLIPAADGSTSFNADYDLYQCLRPVWVAHLDAFDEVSLWLTGIPGRDQPWMTALLDQMPIAASGNEGV